MSGIVNVCEYLIHDADLFPDKIAIKDYRGNVRTYSQLLTTAKKISKSIYHHVKGIHRPVVILCDRNVESIELFLAVLWSGNFYVPLDVAIPSHRLNQIIGDMNNPYILRADKETVDRLCVEAEDEENNTVSWPWQRCIDEDLLYVVYTSGSTGKPKGVAKRQKSIIDMVDRFTEAFDFPNELVMANQAHFDFDVSAKDIYLTLKMAGTMVIIPSQYFSMPGRLIKYLIENNVNVLIWAVSALRLVANFKLIEKNIPEKLQLVMFSGEVMQPKYLRYWQEKLPNVTYVNLYAPSEIAFNCAYYIIGRMFDDDEVIPIGKAFKNCDVFLNDKNEICVRGTCVAAGYYGNIEKTKKVFCQDSRQDAYRDIVYHTGDIGKYDNAGNIVFIGRTDNQIKHTGHRIELGEIEAAVASVEGVNISCVVFNEEKDQIILFYESMEELKNKILEKLKETLPIYMLPSEYIRMDRLPQTSHGKCDRVALKKLVMRKN